jgi:magnesium transporter
MLTIKALSHGEFRSFAASEPIKELIARSDSLVWVDMVAPTAAERQLLHTEFQFHPLALEDIEHRHQRPKIEVYSNHYFIVVYGVHLGELHEGIEMHEISIFLGKSYVVTVHSEPVPELQAALERWEHSTDSIGSDIGAVLYAIMDGLVDEYFPLIDELADRVETLEQKIFERFDREALNDIFTMKKDLLALRRVVAPERDVFNVLMRRDPPILPVGSVIYFQDVYDHTVRVLDSIDTYRDLLSSALDAYLSVQSNVLNEAMRRLTVISTIFLPLTFLSGFFGMNFDSLPFHEPLAMWISLGIMALTPVGMYLWFRSRGLSD